MIVTVLAVSFLILVGFVAFVGYKTIIQRASPTKEELATERCAICRERIAKELLVEREIGDYKLLYFCRTCILGLAADLNSDN